MNTRNACRPALAMAAALALSSTAHGIVYRNDMTDALSLGLANQDQFKATGTVGGAAGGGTGTLILSDWVVTAKHVTTGDANGTTGASFTIGGTTYTGQVYANPANDFSLIHLTSGVVPSSITPIAPGFFGGESGKLVWLVGYGGHASVAGQASVTYDGKLRAGTNVVREYQNPYLYYDNANTGTTSSVYESSTAPGDSGGPMYQQVNGTWYVVGETFGAGGQGFIHTPTNANSAFILSTIRAVKNDSTFTFATPTGPTALTWDADVTVDGNGDGAGTWDIQRTNFRSAGTGFNYQWDNALKSDVTFGSAAGAAGVVTIAATNVTSGTLIAGGAGPAYTASGVTAHNLTFNAASSGTYTLASAGGAPLTLVNNGATDPTITANVGATISAPIASSAATLTKAGVGTLTLSGTNTFTSKVTVAAGTLRLASPVALPGYNTAGKITVAAGAGLTFNVGGSGGWTESQTVVARSLNNLASGSTTGYDTTGGDFTITQALGGAINYVKLGANTLTHAVASSYTGNTVIDAGTVALGPSGRLPTNTPLVFTGSSTLALGGVNQSVGSLTLADGVTGTVAGGTLTYVAPSGGSLGGNGTVLDGSDLTGFTFAQPGQSLLVNGNAAAVVLGDRTAITAAALNVGTGNYGSSTNTTTTLTLGGTTALNVNAMQFGNYHASAVVNVGAGGVGQKLMLRGQNAADTAVAALVVGFNSAGAQNQSATFDVTGMDVDARVTTMTVGDYEPSSGSAATTGTFIMSAGTLTADAVTLAYTRPAGGGGAGGTTSGNFNQAGGAVNVGVLTLGQVGKLDAGAVTQNATYTLGTPTVGATLAAGSITAGAITTTAANTTATRKLNFNNGRITTLNASSDLTITGLAGGATAANKTLSVVLAATGTHALTAPAGRTITVADSAPISGAGALSIDGPGAVALNAANTYTGGTIVSAGMLRVDVAARTPLLSGTGTDVQNGRVAFAYTSAANDPTASIRSLLTSGYAAGFASGTLRSTTANSARGLGYGNDGAAVTIAATLYGDADLDYDVDFNDFLALQSAFGQTATRFDQGNFNYDDATDFNDFLMLQSNFGQSLNGTVVAFTAAQFAAMTAFGEAVSVPEPGALVVIAVAAMGCRRSRKQN